jgi:pimeloyl-ACP methyl ester carboxylesterase
MEEMMVQFISGEAACIFDGIKVPVFSVNGDLWPVDYEANRRHMQSFETITLKDTDHFLMLDRPYAFNQALEQAIYAILRKAAKK